MLHGKQSYKINPENIVLIRANTTYELTADHTTADTVHLCGDGVEVFITNLATGVYALTDPEAIHAIHDAASKPASPDPAAISAGAYSLVAKFAQQAAAGSTFSLQSRYEKLRPVLEYIIDHYAKKDF